MVQGEKDESDLVVLSRQGRGGNWSEKVLGAVAKLGHEAGETRSGKDFPSFSKFCK